MGHKEDPFGKVMGGKVQRKWLVQDRRKKGQTVGMAVP